MSVDAVSVADEPNNQHVVTEAYLRQFAAERIFQRWDKESGYIKRRQSVRKACSELFFNTVHNGDERNHELETFWGEIESGAMPFVRMIVGGNETARAREESKKLVALHIARSYTVQMLADKVYEDGGRSRATRIEQSDEWKTRFSQQFGRLPEGGELYDFVMNWLEADYKTNEFRTEVMKEQYEKFLNRLQPLHAQVVRSNNRIPQIGFVVSDNPVAMWNEPGISIGLGFGLSMDQVEHIMTPLSPTVALLFTTHNEPDGVVTPSTVQMLNQFTWRNAHRHVFVHPSLDPHRCVRV